MRPTFLYPETLSEAVQMLAEYGQRACLIVGSESPPPGMSPADVFIDVGHLAELAGIHQLGGKVIVGANTPHSLVARSSLIRTHGACLAEGDFEAEFDIEMDEEAERVLSGLIGRSPRFGAAFNAMGCFLSRRGRYREAAEHFAAATGIEPDNERFRRNLEFARSMSVSTGTGEPS